MESMRILVADTLVRADAAPARALIARLTMNRVIGESLYPINLEGRKKD